MRIAILLPRLDCNAPKPLAQAETLAEEGNDVAIFALSVVDVEPQKARLCIMGMPESLFWSRVYQLFFPLDLWKTIRWLPKLKEFDLIIAHLYPVTWLAYLAKKIYKVKYTLWYHGVPPPELHPYFYEKVYIRLFRFLMKLTVSNADYAVAVSRFAQEELRKYTSVSSDVEYNEVDPKRFHPGIDGSVIRERHQLGDAPIIFSLGRVSPIKGFHQLLQAFNMIKHTIPDARLVIAGRHDYDYYSKQLREMSDDSVIFVGYISEEDKPCYYAMCDLYASCSAWETFNIPIAEAQACGKPAVAFDIGPHPEVIDDNGILVEAGNIDKFAQACITKLRQVRKLG